MIFFFLLPCLCAASLTVNPGRDVYITSVSLAAFVAAVTVCRASTWRRRVGDNRL